MLLRKSVYGGSVRRSWSQPNLELQESLISSEVHDTQSDISDVRWREKAKLNTELEHVEAIRNGLNKQGEKLSNFMNTLRISSNDLSGEFMCQESEYI